MTLDPRLSGLVVEASKTTPNEAAGLSKLGAIMRGRREPSFVTIPNTDEQVALVLLSGSDRQECLGAALERFEQLGIPVELRSYTDLEAEITWQVLHRVMRDPEDLTKQFATNVDEVRDNLTDDERDTMITQYLDHEERNNPDPTQQPGQWHAEIEAALKKNSAHEAASLLINFGSRSLVSYLVTTVRPLLNAPMPKSIATHTSQQNSDAEQTRKPKKPQGN